MIWEYIIIMLFILWVKQGRRTIIAPVFAAVAHGTNGTVCFATTNWWRNEIDYNYIDSEKTTMNITLSTRKSRSSILHSPHNWLMEKWLHTVRVRSVLFVRFSFDIQNECLIYSKSSSNAKVAFGGHCCCGFSPCSAVQLFVVNFSLFE